MIGRINHIAIAVPDPAFRARLEPLLQSLLRQSFPNRNFTLVTAAQAACALANQSMLSASKAEDEAKAKEAALQKEEAQNRRRGLQKQQRLLRPMSRPRNGTRPTPRPPRSRRRRRRKQR